ncbi:MAG: hypothetical protein ACRD21_04515 [Vicinamibacteria bacterium]
MRIFLLSPASLGGERARWILEERGKSDLARRLRSREGAPLGEVYTFLSSLYFRGKLTYSSVFSNPPPGVPGALIITPGEGLRSPEDRVDLPRLLSMAKVPITAKNERYCEPLFRDALKLVEQAGPECDVVLLGSVATGKYVDVLLPVFGTRLRFPVDFVGRGDMSRGGLLLRRAERREELEYAVIESAARHGPRPPRLEKRPRPGS